jgi:signal transduction histidine kinase
MKFSQLIHPDDYAENMSLVKKLLAGKIPYFVVENRYLTKNEELVWVRKSVSLVRTKEETPCWIIALIEDISTRIDMEAQLKLDVHSLELIQKLSATLIQADDIKPLMQTIMNIAITIMKADKGTLQLIDDESLTIVAHRGHKRPFLKFFSSAEEVSSACGEAIRQRKRIIVEDVELSPLFAGKKAGTVLRNAGVRAVQSTPIICRKGKLLGALSTQWSVPYSPDENDLRRFDILVRQAADLIERKNYEKALREAHDTLEQRVRERTAELASLNKKLVREIKIRQGAEKQLKSLSMQLIEAQEEERKIIAQELHDSVGQSVTSLKFAIEQVLNESSEQIDNRTAGSLRKLIKKIQQTVVDTNRIGAGLRPATLDHLGILATVNWFCREYNKVYKGIKITKHIGIEEDEIPEELKVVIYRVLQEGLNNVAKHSKADKVNISLKKMDSSIELTLRDNGRGFKNEELFFSETGEKGLGLPGIMKRIEFSGGSCEIISGKGKGTTIKGVWPLR